MKKKVLFFSCEPGGAEVLIPVIRLVRAQPGFEATVAGYGHALKRFAGRNIACLETHSVQEVDSFLLDSERPDLLITSATSLPEVDMSEKYLWRQARSKGIASIAFLDQWQNYAIRFSGPGGGGRLTYLPDWINGLNAIGCSEMISEGFDKDRLLALGHPYLSSLRSDISTLEPAGLKMQLQIPAGAKVVLFVSEPIREYYGGARGYDQYQALEFLLADLAKSVEKPRILVKLHPKDNAASFRGLINKFHSLAPQLIDDDLSSLECLTVADFVFGMSSIMLIEAYVLGKSVVSLQPGLCGGDPLVLTRHGLIPLITKQNRSDLLSLGCPEAGHFDVHFDSDKFLHFLSRVIADPHPQQGT